MFGLKSLPQWSQILFRKSVHNMQECLMYNQTYHFFFPKMMDFLSSQSSTFNQTCDMLSLLIRFFYIYIRQYQVFLNLDCIIIKKFTARNKTKLFLKCMQ